VEKWKFYKRRKKTLTMRQILIEKYIEPSTIETDGVWIYKTWLNKDGYLHSFLGHPAMVFYSEGFIVSQFWCEKDKQHRSRNLPAEIHYYNEKTTRKSWYKKGKLIERR